MSSTLSQELKVMLAELLAGEKDATRVCLRDELDRRVEPMLDSIFNRLQTKLTNGLERIHSVGGNGELMNPTVHKLSDVTLSQSYPVNTQPSTLNPQSNHQPHSNDYEPENDPEILAEVKREMEAERQIQLNHMHNNQMDNRQLELQVNGNQSINGLERTQSGAGDCDQMVNHNDQLELPPNQMHQPSFVVAQPSTSSHLSPQHQNVHYSNQQPNDPIHCNENFNQQSQLRPFVQLIIQQNAHMNSVYHDELCNESSSGQVQHSSSLPATIVNEQFNQNLNGEDEDEGVCECDECVNGIEIDDEVDDDDDDSDSVQWIEDVESDQELAQPVKKPQMNSTQPNNATQAEVARQFPRQPTEEAQPNQVTKQFITVHLQCPLSDCRECPDTFTENQLTQHMFDVHSMGPFRCLVKDCAQAFDSSHLLSKHI